MTTITPLVRNILLAVCAVLFAGGLVGTVTVDEDSESVDTVAGSTTSTTFGTIGGNGSTTSQPVVVTNTSTTVAPQQSTTTAKPVAGNDPGTLTTTRPGLYRYRSTNDGEASETQIRIEKAGSSGSEERVKMKQTAEEGSQELTLGFRPDGQYVLDTVFTFGTTKIDCDWNPDIKNMASPAKAGMQWSVDTRCTAQFNGEPAEFHLTGSNKIDPAEKIKIGGKDLDVWPVQRVTKLTIDTKFNGQPVHIQIDSSGIDHFSNKLGLDVKSTAKTRNSGFGGDTQEHTTTRELLNTDPE